jgi:predicted transcriptional regulator
MGKTEKQILQVLSDFGPLSLDDIANEIGKKPKAVFSSLRKLFSQEKITNDPGTRRYMLVEEE